MLISHKILHLFSDVFLRIAYIACSLNGWMSNARRDIHWTTGRVLLILMRYLHEHIFAESI